MKSTIIKWGMISILTLLVLFLLIINFLSVSLNSPDYAIEAYFEDLNVNYQIHRIPFKDKTLRYVETGLQSDSVPLLFFIHGAPGTWDAFKEYLADYDLNQNFRLISMDRLGYGGSEKGQSETDLEIHADAANQILKKYRSSKTIIVSHSYGSPISVIMATKEPTLIDGLVMCSPVNDPESEPLKWYSYLANLNVSRLVLPDFIDVASDEKMSHRNSLEKVMRFWKEVQCPVLQYHGKKDNLAPFKGNVDHSMQHFQKNKLTIIPEEKGAHLLIWFKSATFKNIILNFYENL